MSYAEATAADIYNRLSGDRESFIRAAEESAELTIPSLFPREGKAHGQEFRRPRNWVGPRGVNHISARILMSLLPAGSQFVRMVPDGAALEILEQDQEARAEVEEALAGIEREVQKSVASGTLRVVAVDAIKQLVVAGNVLTYSPDDSDAEELVAYPLSNFVVDRDLDDNLLVVVLCQEVDPDTLDEETRAFAQDNPADMGSFGAGVLKSGKSVRIYTKIWREGRMFKVQQEIGGKVIPGTEGVYPPSKLPYRVHRWEKVDNEAYGRGLVEQYYGTLNDVEILETALVEGAIAASRVIPLVSPTGVTDPQDVNRQKNGEAISGEEGDIVFLQMQKYADFRVAKEQLDEKNRALSSVFLLNFARDAERVTAEEIRMFAQELESTHSGVFLRLAAEFQLPIVSRIIDRLQKDKVIPELSDKLREHIKPTPLTGVDALARGQDLERIHAVFNASRTVIGPDTLAQYANPGTILQFMLTAAGLDIPGAVKSDAEVQAIMQQQQQAAMSQQMLGGAVPQLAKGAVENPAVAQGIADAVNQGQ